MNTKKEQQRSFKHLFLLTQNKTIVLTSRNLYSYTTSTSTIIAQKNKILYYTTI